MRIFLLCKIKKLYCAKFRKNIVQYYGIFLIYEFTGSRVERLDVLEGLEVIKRLVLSLPADRRKVGLPK